MKLTKEKKIQVLLKHGVVHEHTYSINRQTGLLPEYVGCVEFDWSFMSNYHLLESEIPCEMPFYLGGYKIGLFYQILFNYDIKTNPWQVVKVSERVKTTAFNKSYSLN